ncbi:MAG: trypsin-like peptidase domain-containing protein [Paenibacillaceae bacterium]|nr:trypsin-like peptidase domain-containing protein [Paenibacillaceae bacterium]
MHPLLLNFVLQTHITRRSLIAVLALWLAGCTAWAPHPVFAQNNDSLKYRSSVLRVLATFSPFKTTGGSAVVVQKRSEGDMTVYTLATARHIFVSKKTTIFHKNELKDRDIANKVVVHTLDHPNKKYTATLLHPLPFEQSQCDNIAQSSENKRTCSYDLALLEISLKNTEKLHVLPFSKARPRPSDPVTLAGFPEGEYRELSTSIKKIADINHPFYADGQTIESNVAVRPQHSGGAIINSNDELLGITQSILAESTFSLYVEQLCAIWGNDHLKSACASTMAHRINTSLNSPNVPSPLPKTPAPTPKQAPPPNVLPPKSPIPLNHPAIVTIVQNNKTVGYGVIFRQHKNNFYIATTASFSSSEDADQTTTVRDRKKTLIQTNKNVLLTSVREMHKVSLNKTHLTILLVSTRTSLTVASFCPDAQSASRIPSKNPCITHVPGNTLSGSHIRQMELCRFYADVCKKQKGL